MRILVLGNDNFVTPLKALGHEVFHGASQGGADVAVAGLDPDWREVSRAAKLKGLNFDAVLVTDDIGCRTLPTGLWAAEAVTVFYGLDAPLNGFWQKPYARLFDVALLDQPREAQELAEKHAGAAWLPVGVDLTRYDGPAAQTRLPGVGFVGVLDPMLRPKRTAILDRVASRVPIHTRGGRREKWFETSQAVDLYRRCQVVLNENLFPGVTTRPLEVMAAGGCLLSEAAPGAMDRLFVDGEHLCFFQPGTLEQNLEELLSDAQLRQRLAKSGREEVWQSHGLQRRAQEIVRRIEEMAALAPEARPRAKAARAMRLEGEALLAVAMRWPGEMLEQRLRRAVGRLQAVVADEAQSLAASRGLGKAMLVLGMAGQAAPHLRRASELGGENDRLIEMLAVGSAGRPGEGAFHWGVGQEMVRHGFDMCPGFNRQGLPMPLWFGLEHLLESVRLEPDRGDAWAMLGDILLERGAPNQAFDCYCQAGAAGNAEELYEKQARAAREGYLA